MARIRQALKGETFGSLAEYLTSTKGLATTIKYDGKEWEAEYVRSSVNRAIVKHAVVEIKDGKNIREIDVVDEDVRDMITSGKFSMDAFMSLNKGNPLLKDKGRETMIRPGAEATKNNMGYPKKSRREDLRLDADREGIRDDFFKPEDSDNVKLLADVLDMINFGNDNKNAKERTAPREENANLIFASTFSEGVSMLRKTVAGGNYKEFFAHMYNYKVLATFMSFFAQVDRKAFDDTVSDYLAWAKEKEYFVDDIAAMKSPSDYEAAYEAFEAEEALEERDNLISISNNHIVILDSFIPDKVGSSTTRLTDLTRERLSSFMKTTQTLVNGAELLDKLHFEMMKQDEFTPDNDAPYRLLSRKSTSSNANDAVTEFVDGLLDIVHTDKALNSIDVKYNGRYVPWADYVLDIIDEASGEFYKSTTKPSKKRPGSEAFLPKKSYAEDIARKYSTRDDVEELELVEEIDDRPRDRRVDRNPVKKRRPVEYVDRYEEDDYEYVSSGRRKRRPEPVKKRKVSYRDEDEYVTNSKRRRPVEYVDRYEEDDYEYVSSRRRKRYDDERPGQLRTVGVLKDGDEEIYKNIRPF